MRSFIQIKKELKLWKPTVYPDYAGERYGFQVDDSAPIREVCYFPPPLTKNHVLSFVEIIEAFDTWVADSGLSSFLVVEQPAEIGVDFIALKNNKPTFLIPVSLLKSTNKYPKLKGIYDSIVPVVQQQWELLSNGGNQGILKRVIEEAIFSSHSESYINDRSHQIIACEHMIFKSDVLNWELGVQPESPSKEASTQVVIKTSEAKINSFTKALKSFEVFRETYEFSAPKRKSNSVGDDYIYPEPRSEELFEIRSARHFKPPYNHHSVLTYVAIVTAFEEWIKQSGLFETIAIKEIAEIGTDYVAFYNDRYSWFESTLNLEGSDVLLANQKGYHNAIPIVQQEWEKLDESGNEGILKNVIKRSVLEPAMDTYFDIETSRITVYNATILDEDISSWKESDLQKQLEAVKVYTKTYEFETTLDRYKSFNDTVIPELAADFMADVFIKQAEQVFKLNLVDLPHLYGNIFLQIIPAFCGGKVVDIPRLYYEFNKISLQPVQENSELVKLVEHDGKLLQELTARKDKLLPALMEQTMLFVKVYREVANGETQKLENDVRIAIEALAKIGIEVDGTIGK